VVDEVGDPPLKFLKAAERVKTVPNTTHRLGQGGIPGLKVAFVSTLNPFLHFFPAKTHMLVSFCPLKLDCLRYLCDANCIAKTSIWSFGLLGCDSRYDAICFVSCFASVIMQRSALRKSGRRLEQILYACFLLVVLWGQYKRYKRKITTAEMNMGQEHGKEHLFQHVDALLVSRFGWDSIYVCVEIVFIYGVD
jgi:hypothetical protein